MCVFCWYAVFTDLKRKHKKYNQKKKKRQENTTKLKSRNRTMNYKEYHIKQERAESIDLNVNIRRDRITN